MIVHREYETDATMTSRFGKTYSRRGGDGTSKFDEVFSNKRATLSTKWGETTYKAKVGAKRPGLKTEVTDQTKRTKVSDGDGSEDPFGFDSDDESRPVTSRNVAQPKPKVTSTGGSQASLTLEPNSRVNLPASVEAVAPSRAPFTLSTERSAHKVPEDPGKFFNTSTTGMFFPEGFFFSLKKYIGVVLMFKHYLICSSVPALIPCCYMLLECFRCLTCLTSQEVSVSLPHCINLP